MANKRFLLQSLWATNQPATIMTLQQFKKEAAKKIRNAAPGSYLVVQFDGDRFADLYCCYGYAKGEALFTALSDAIVQGRDKKHFFMGQRGDKFLVLLKNTAHPIEALQRRLDKAVANLGFEKYVGVVKFVFGAYALRDPQESMDAVIDKVNVAHKTAARTPNKTTVWYDQVLEQRIAQENYYNEHMLEGLAQGQFRVYLQRQVVLAQPNALRAKALVRWVLPSGRMAYPDSFIRQFERNGMMMHLDFYIIEEVCKYLRTLRKTEAREMRVEINLSPVTLFQPDFMQRFLSIVSQYGISPDRLLIELQRVDLLAGAQDVFYVVEQLQRKGFAFAAEMMMGGADNFSIFVELPINVIKIDRSLLRATDANDRMTVVLTGLVQAAHQFGLEVICEGVEHQADIQLLHGIGCDVIQGYYLMKAVPKEEFLYMVSEVREQLHSKLETANVPMPLF